MPMHPHELVVFFDQLYSDLRKEWELMVDFGEMTETKKQRKETRMEEIGAILRERDEARR